MILAAAVIAAAAAPATLPAADQTAIMRLLCQGTLARDARGPVCRHPDTIDGDGAWEQRWHSAWRGRFVAHPGEWIVTLYRSCAFRYCPFDSHLVRKVGGKWRAVRPLLQEDDIAYEQALGHDCLVLAGTSGALDRLACLDGVGPQQGFLFERLRVLSFAKGEVSEQKLMARSQGGECYLESPEPEMRADQLELLGDDGRALTVRLRVRAAPCDRATPHAHGPIVERAEHVLRFVRDGAALLPDAATAALIGRYGWTEGP